MGEKNAKKIMFKLKKNITELEAQLTAQADSYSLSLGDLSQYIVM